jgi:hypothetical protein
VSGHHDQNEARRKRLGLPPDINKRRLALAVLTESRLEEHERLFIARLLAPELFTKAPQKNVGRPRSTAAALKADEIAEKYFYHRVMFPHQKHKEEAAPIVAAFFRVSPSYVDKVLGQLDPARRKEMESQATALAERCAKSPNGIENAKWMAIEAIAKWMAERLAKRKSSKQLGQPGIPK